MEPNKQGPTMSFFQTRQLQYKMDQKYGTFGPHNFMLTLCVLTTFLLRVQAFGQSSRSEVAIPNHWICYVHTVLFHSEINHAENYSSGVTLLHKLSCDIAVETFLKKKSLRFKDSKCVGDKKNRNRRWTSLLSHFTIRAVERDTCLHTGQWKSRIVDFHFNLDKNLQLYVTIIHMNIRSLMVQTPECFPNVYLWSRGQGYRRGFVFCGIRNNLVIFTPYSMVLLRVNYTHTIQFYVDSLFDIRASDENRTYTAHIAQYGDIVSYFQLKNYLFWRIEHIFYISTFACNVLFVWLKIISKRTPVYMFYGPGFKSPQHVVNRSPSIFGATGYQCIMKTFADVEIKFASHLIQYYNTNIISNRNQFWYASENNYNYNRYTLFTSREKENNHLKISINFANISNTNSKVNDGLETSTCQCGGVWFFGFNSTAAKTFPYRPKELFSLCSPTTSQSQSIQNIYSSNSSVLLVAYSYEHYSSINITFQVSVLDCQPFVIDVCADLPRQTESLGDSSFGRVVRIPIDVTPFKCAVVQLVNHGKSEKQNDQGHIALYLSKNNTNAEYQYLITGHFSAQYLHSPPWANLNTLCTSFQMNQFLMIGGENYIKNKINVSVSKLHHETEILLSNKTNPCMFDISKTNWLKIIYYVMAGHYPFLNINPTNMESVFMKLAILSQMPTTDLGLVFFYKSLSIKSWLEINFSPVGLPVTERPLFPLGLSSIFQKLNQMFLKKVMDIRLIGEPDTDQVLVDVNIKMKVGFPELPSDFRVCTNELTKRCQAKDHSHLQT